MNKLYVAEISPLIEEKVFTDALSKVGELRRQKVLQYKGNMDKARSLAAGLLFCYGYRENSNDSMGKKAIPEEGVAGPHGKPGPIDCAITADAIVEGKEAEGKLYYNLSHSGKYAACLMGKRELGLDIQERRPVGEGLARRFFAAEEQAYLEEMKINQGKKAWEDAFFTLWTLKEAYVKYSGRGMGEGFSGFSVLPLFTQGRQEIHGKICFGSFARLEKDYFWGCVSEEKGEVLPEMLPVFQLF